MANTRAPSSEKFWHRIIERVNELSSVTPTEFCARLISPKRQVSHTYILFTFWSELDKVRHDSYVHF